MLPVEPGGTGQPPSSPKELSKESIPCPERGEHVGEPLAAGVVEVGGQLHAAERAPAPRRRTRATWRGLAIPVVSPNATSSQPKPASFSAISKTRSGGTSPSYGTAEAGRDHALAADPRVDRDADRPLEVRRATRRSSGSRSSGCGSPTPRGRSSPPGSGRAAAARSPAPSGSGSGPSRRRPRAARTAASTSAPSASCGITSGRTNEVTSIRCSPESASIPISRTFSSVGITSGSFWNPSRGPTSRMRTLWGSSSAISQRTWRVSSRRDRADFDHAPLVGPDADRAVALLDLDVEAELAARRRSRGASSGPCRSRPRPRRRRA